VGIIQSEMFSRITFAWSAPELLGSETRWLGWQDPNLKRSPHLAVSCSAGVQVDLCNSCEVASCTAICDSDVRVRASDEQLQGVYLRFRGTVPKRGWIRFLPGAKTGVPAQRD
jgi:hypothetical protein